MNDYPARLASVKAAWVKVSNGQGFVGMETVAQTYDTSVHPEVRSGEKQEQQMLRELMCAWDSNEDGLISQAEFFDFYSYASAAVERDESFVRVMKTAWRM